MCYISNYGDGSAAESAGVMELGADGRGTGNKD